MKSILKFKLALISLIILSSNINASYYSKEIYKAAKKTAARKGHCPEGVKELIDSPFSAQGLRQAASNFTLEDTGFIFEASVERFLDCNNEESMSEHVEFFRNLNKVLKNKNTHISNFLSRIEKLRGSTSITQIKKTMESETEALYTALKQSGNWKEKQVADKIKNHLDHMMNQKGKAALLKALIIRAKNNKQ